MMDNAIWVRTFDQLVVGQLKLLSYQGQGIANLLFICTDVMTS